MAITLTITLVVSLPVGVVIGCCGMWFTMKRRGGGRGGVEKRELAAIYEEPAPPVETAITLSENQAYGRVSSQR